MKKTKFLVYLFHFLLNWEDRMWSFGIGLFLINFSPESLLLTAIYGFSTGGAVFLFGAVVGDLVDRTPRFQAVRTALIVRKVCLCLCASLICIVHWLKDEISAAVSDNILLYISYFAIILIGVISTLSNIARRIAVERDWVVEICEKKKNRLAAMTATMRAIDLIAQVLTPLIIGQVIDATEIGYGAILVAVWNIIAVFLEIFVAWKVYISVPSLKSKMYESKRDERVVHHVKSILYMLYSAGSELDKMDITNSLTDSEEGSLKECGIDKETNHNENEKDVKKQNNPNGKENISETDHAKDNHKQRRPAIKKIFSNIITLYKGWKIYRQYEVAYAGLCAAFLYMTVLSFDSITVGFGYSQGLSAATLGQLRAGVAAAGIIGTILYPRVRRCISTEHTGILSLAYQILCLTLCVVSVFTPGSPFDMTSSPNTGQNSTDSSRIRSDIVTCYFFIDTQNYSIIPSSLNESYMYLINDDWIQMNSSNGTFPRNDHNSDFKENDASIWLLISGIIASRIGLVMCTLAIQQLFLERVKEEERGIVGGVQNTLNWLLDMLKFVIVIFLPHPNQYGLLVIISFSFICLAFLFYVKFLRTARKKTSLNISSKADICPNADISAKCVGSSAEMNSTLK